MILARFAIRGSFQDQQKSFFYSNGIANLTLLQIILNYKAVGLVRTDVVSIKRNFTHVLYFTKSTSCGINRLSGHVNCQY